MDNITQHKSFLWHLDFEPFTWHTFYGEQCPPFVTEENKEAWKRYLKKVIKKHLKAEVMNTPEFRDIELQLFFPYLEFFLPELRGIHHLSLQMFLDDFFR